MIEIDGVELRTAAQWEKKRRHVKKGQLGKGVERTWRSPNGNTTAQAALRSAESSMKSLLDAMDSEDELSRSLMASEERLDGLRWQLRTSPESSGRGVRG